MQNKKLGKWDPILIWKRTAVFPFHPHQVLKLREEKAILKNVGNTQNTVSGKKSFIVPIVVIMYCVQL
jgi:hypothetical protein